MNTKIRFKKIPLSTVNYKSQKFDINYMNYELNLCKLRYFK